MKTLKGFELTPDQQRRRHELTPFLTPGPTYNRRVRDSLASMQYAEDSAQVEHWLALAEAGVK